MATEIVPFAPEHRDALRRFAECTFPRPRGEAFFRWRYEEGSFHRAWLALRDGECLAMESAIRRPYRIGADVVFVLEVFDWFCLPELRNSGLGVRVMQRLMREPDPLLVVGGTPDTQGLLPRLKWQVMGTSTRWILPLRAERTVDALAESYRIPRPLAGAVFDLALRPWLRPRVRKAPESGRVVLAGVPGEELQALYRDPLGYGTIPLWTEEHLRWLAAGHPAAGHFVPLYFVRRDELVGWALVRLYATATGRDAELVELMAPAPDADLYTWMVSEAARVADAFGAGMIGAGTSCDALGEALRRNRFRAMDTKPIQVWWPGSRREMPGPMLIGSNSGDSPLLPHAERWWDVEPERRLAPATVKTAP